ncbi:fasciclin domain-containing protein [Pararhizobium haloflavum]|uniref:fasciclin domain-containing protein n=1 Tax=Pararhizobium haloflavum TaxID=2037914 RepID=UPI000C193422|nr:fasciclin domain-containing protein [Pararhizobium haloflavum]
MNRNISGGLALIAALAAGAAHAQSNPTVGGAPMFENRSIVENAVNSPVHTTLVAAVKAAGLVETLSGAGPFTVFAPVNSGFAALPAGTVETLLMPENKDQLVKVLTAHVVAGDLSGGELMRDVMANGGQLELQTVSGDTLTVMQSGRGLALMDENGGTSVITTADVNQSNGVIHVVNQVLVPN